MSEKEKFPLPKEVVVKQNYFLPVVVVACVALLFWGLTKVISVEKGLDDLVNDLETKTFGNKWVAAFELSKRLASSTYTDEEALMLKKRLSNVYFSSVDKKTKKFLVVALGSLPGEKPIPVFLDAVKDGDNELQFHGISALSKVKNQDVDWSSVISLVGDDDKLLSQAATYTLASNRVPEAKDEIIAKLSSSDQLSRYVAATALINYREPVSEKITREILLLDYENSKLKIDGNKIENLKLNVLNAYIRNSWIKNADIIEKLSKDDSRKRVRLKATESLNLLKN